MARTTTTVSSWRMVGLHSLGLASAAYSFSFLSQWETPLTNSFGWYFQDIAVLALVPFAGICAVGAAADLTGSSVLLRAKRSLALVGMPLAVTVCFFSYTTKLVNRGLTDIPGHIMPLAGHLSIHLVPTLVLIADLMANNSLQWTTSASKAFLIHFTSMLGYWAWIETCYAKTGWYYVDWIEKLSYPQRGLFIAAWSCLMMASYYVLKSVKGH